MHGSADTLVDLVTSHAAATDAALEQAPSN
jgi:hypothetical protein